MKEISLEEAKVFAAEATNYVGHSTVNILGITPAQTREVCERYDEALVVKVHGRLERREYSVEEIEEIGYSIYLVSKAG